MFNIGPMEVVVIVVVALVVLGPQRLPDAMRQVGRAVAEARRWSSSLTTTVQSAFDDGPPRTRPAEAGTPVITPAPAAAAPAAPTTAAASTAAASTAAAASTEVSA